MRVGNTFADGAVRGVYEDYVAFVSVGNRHYGLVVVGSHIGDVKIIVESENFV